MAETKVTADELLSGNMRMRVGGDPTDFTIPGTNVYAEQRKNMQSFFGSSLSVGGVATVVFPTPFQEKPIVIANVLGNTLGNASILSITKSGFTFQANNLLGILTPNIPVLWQATGLRPPV